MFKREFDSRYSPHVIMIVYPNWHRGYFERVFFADSTSATITIYAPVTELAYVIGLNPIFWGFDFPSEHHFGSITELAYVHDLES